MVRSLYVHVPFCPSICPYCDFHKMLRDEGLVARYLDRLEREIAEVSGVAGVTGEASGTGADGAAGVAGVAAYHPGPLETVYFGGGTPSHLGDAELVRVFEAIDAAWGHASGRDASAGDTAPARLETTLEADPLTFDARRLKLFADLGVSRLSIGLQSTQDQVLSFLGRVHDSRTGLEAVDMAVASGLRVNVDVMTAIEGQDLELDLRRVVGAGVKHVSVYSLTIEPNTPFALRGVSVDEDLDADSFTLAAEVLGELDLERYEVSNHAVPGDESRHNLAYWRGEHYLGVGPGASSYLPPTPDAPFGTRVKSPPIKGWLLGAPPEIDLLSADDLLLERLLTGLRTREGVDLAEVERVTGLDLETVAPRWLHDTTGHGLLTLGTDRRLRATATGLTRLDAVLRAFVATASTSTSTSTSKAAPTTSPTPTRRRR